MTMLNLFSEFIINIAAINRLIQDYLTVPLICFFLLPFERLCVSLIISICFGALIGRPTNYIFLIELENGLFTLNGPVHGLLPFFWIFI